MVREWWQPVQFTNSEVPVPFDGVAVTRHPLIVTHEPSLPRPEFFKGPKPSYIWVGDIGESIPADKALKLDRIDPYISMSTEELDKIQEQRSYCMSISYCVFDPMFDFSAKGKFITR